MQERFILLAGLLLSVAAALSSCNRSHDAVRTNSPDVDTAATVVDAELADSTSEIVTGPVTDTTSGPNASIDAGPTIGERLKRLDSLMTVAPSDSLAVLMERYEALLDSAVSARSPESPTRDVSTATAPEESTPDPTAAESTRAEDEIESVARTRPDSLERTATDDPPRTEPVAPVSDPVSTIDADDVDWRSNVDGGRRSVPYSMREKLGNVTETSTTPPADQPIERQPTITPEPSSTPQLAEQITTRTPPRPQFDPREYRGARPAEIRHYERSIGIGVDDDSHSPSARSARTTSESTVSSIRPNRVDGADSEPITRRTPAARFTRGLAHFRAGRYSHAVDELESVTRSSSRFSTQARYYLGLSYERLGQLGMAVTQLRQVKGVRGSLGDRAWIAEARIEARRGNRNAARQSLLLFTSNRPTSRYLPRALRMLQQI